jgi:hypothetical protein
MDFTSDIAGKKVDMVGLADDKKSFFKSQRLGIKLRIKLLAFGIIKESVTLDDSQAIPL